MITDVEIKTHSLSRYYEIRDWCTKQFGETNNYPDDTWVSREAIGFGYAMFYFSHQKDASWFMLRWL